MLTPGAKRYFTKNLAVNSFHTDLKRKLSIPSIFSLFQEIAWEHAALFGFGYEDLKAQNLFWVLSRLHLEIDSLPNWTEPFSLTTWPSGSEGPFALRDYIIRGEDNNEIVRATSSWLVVDSLSRRPKRPDTLKGKMPLSESTRATPQNAPKIENLQGKIMHEKQYTVGVCDIDVNGHINNTKYIEWAINSFSMEDYKKSKIEAICINFLSEGFYGDACSHQTEQVGDTIRKTRITRIADSKDLAVVEIHIANS